MIAFRVLLLMTYLALVTGHNCIKAGGKKKCTKGECDCNNGLVCMDIKRGSSKKTKSLCGAPQGQGCWCDPSLTSVEACQDGLTCQEDNKGRFKCECDNTPRSQCLPSGSGWKMTYHHDLNGALISGSSQTLIDEVRTGAEVKVWSPFLGVVNVQKVSIDYNSDLERECVHGQALFWAQNVASLANIFFVFSTSGNVHSTQFFIHNPVNEVRINTNRAFEIKWYTRASTAVVEDERQLARLIQDGAHIRVSIDDTFRHLEVADVSDGTVTGVSMIELRDIIGGMEFNTTEQVLLKHWSSNELIQASWLLNDHTLTETEVIQCTPGWLADPCWSFVYRHNGDGLPLSGSKANLIAAVEAGKRIKLRVGNKFYEANIVRQPIGTDKVIAQVFDSIDFDVTVGEWEWLNVHTTGDVNYIRFEVGGDESLSDTTTKMEVTWFKEDRVWTDVTDETTANKNAKIDAGADVRYSVNIDNEIRWYQADYAQKELVLPHLTFSFFNLYNNREVISDAPDYYRRYSFANWDSGTFTYMDYLVGSTTQTSHTVVQSADAKINFFTSPVTP